MVCEFMILGILGLGTMGWDELDRGSRVQSLRVLGWEREVR